MKERIGNVALNPTIDKSRLTYKLDLSESDMESRFAKKLPVQHTPLEILELSEKFTEVYKKNQNNNKYKRELNLLEVIYPETLVYPDEKDWTMGRIDRLYVGVGSSTSVGGVGNYCSFAGMAKLKDQLGDAYANRIDEITTYWKQHDTLTKFYKELSAEANPVISKFVDVHAPTIVSTRLSGTYLYFYYLVEKGIDGMIADVEKELKTTTKTTEVQFLEAAKGTLQLFSKSMLRQAELATEWGQKNPAKQKWFNRVAEACKNAAHGKPQNYLEAIELVWTYSLLSGIINYGRMDRFFGKFVRQDIANGTFTNNEILLITKSIFRQMEALRTAFNGRVIIGGKDIEGDQDAIAFQKIAIQAVMENHLPEPQLTLRWSHGVDPEVYELALKCIETGVTFPMILNDEVLIDAVAKAQKVNYDTAKNYVPFGCGELVLEGDSVGTPNVCENILKVLNITLCRGVDPSDNQAKTMDMKFADYDKITSFEQFYQEFLEFHRRQSDRATQWQERSYEVLANDVAFLFVSVMSKDVVHKHKPILEGGINHLSGSNEVYGSINAYEALWYIKKLVFEDQRFTLRELANIVKKNWANSQELFLEINSGMHYGNDNAALDSFINRVHIDVTTIIQDSAKKTKTLESFGAVYINNHTNAIWGRATAASLDGRKAGEVLANGNTPQQGKDTNGPTAFLNSLARLDLDHNFGMVHNIKFSQSMFKRHQIIKNLFDTYFQKTGSQLMITVANKKDLLGALETPDKYTSLLVRVGGFTARFIDLARDVQIEIVNRTEN